MLVSQAFEQRLRRLGKRYKFHVTNHNNIRSVDLKTRFDSASCPLNVMCGNKYNNASFEKFAEDLKIPFMDVLSVVRAADNESNPNFKRLAHLLSISGY